MSSKNKKSQKAVAKKGGISIASIVYSLIEKGKGNDTVIKVVKQKFPESKINAQHMSWYRRQLKIRNGEVDEAPVKSKKHKISKKSSKEDEDEEDEDEEEEAPAKSKKSKSKKKEKDEDIDDEDLNEDEDEEDEDIEDGEDEEDEEEDEDEEDEEEDEDEEDED